MITPLSSSSEPPSLGNLRARMSEGSNQLLATGVVDGEEVLLSLALKIGAGEPRALGTLVVPHCDFPALGELLHLGAIMMRMGFDYRLASGSASWTLGEET
jgi:hypothetical protein